MVKKNKFFLGFCVFTTIYIQQVAYADNNSSLNNIQLPGQSDMQSVNSPRNSNQLNIPNSKKNADGSITISGGRNNNSNPVITKPLPANPVISSGSGNVNVSSNISIPNSNVNADGTITVRGGNSGNNEAKDRVVNQGKVGGVTATIGKAQASPKNNQIDLQALQEQVKNGTSNLPTMEYNGNVESSSNNTNKKSTVITFKGGEPGYQVAEDNQEQPNKPQRIPASVNNSNGMPMPNARSLPLPALPVLANGMGTPNAAVVPLPPLPGMSGNNVNLPPLPNMTGMIGIPNSMPLNPEEYKMTLNLNTTGEAIDYQGRSIDLPDTNSAEDKIESYWTNLMQEQANSLMAQGAPVKIAIVQTNNVLLRRFVIQGLLKSDDSRVSKIDTGMYPVMSQSFINGKITPTCYLLYDRNNLNVFNEQLLKPLSKATNEQVTAAFVVGHMTAHCMDQFERSKVIPLKDLWYANDLAKYGVQPSAFRRIFYMRMSPSLYFSKQTALFDDIAQRQYEERLADSFGILWAASKYGDKAVLLPNAVTNLRKHLSDSHSHNTIPAIKLSTLNAKTLNNSKLSELWKQARSVQYIAGVSNSLNDNASASTVNSSEVRELRGTKDGKKDYTYTVGEEGKTIKKFGEKHPTKSFNSTNGFKDVNSPFSN